MVTKWMIDADRRWSDETETPRNFDDSGRCYHNGLFADGGPLDRKHLCGACGALVPNSDL